MKESTDELSASMPHSPNKKKLMEEIPENNLVFMSNNNKVLKCSKNLFAILKNLQTDITTQDSREDKPILKKSLIKDRIKLEVALGYKDKHTAFN